jgi:hypothetical protein
LFIWDYVTFEKQCAEIGDPRVPLTAAVVATQRIRLGAMITSVARRRAGTVQRSS